MSHVRTQIRSAAVAALAGLATTGANVFAGRTRPLAKDHPHTLLVYAIEERSDTDAMGGILARILTLAVEGRVTTDDEPDDLLDQIALEVEPVMVAQPLLGGLVLEITLQATRIMTLPAGERHAGEIRMEFRVLYRTQETAPDTAV
jgi:hypothetical protein